MANWASTSYRIEGSESDLNKVYDIIDNFVTSKSKPVLKMHLKNGKAILLRLWAHQTSS